MKYILILIMSLFSMNVYADKCDSQTKSDLLKEANLIKVDYDENEKTEEIDDGYNKYTAVDRTLDISLYNLTNNFSLEISNDNNDSIIYAENNEFKEGKYTFSVDAYNIIKYKVKIYSNVSCDRYLIKTINYTKPMYNSNYNYAVCKDNSNVPYCQKYITNKKYVFDAGKGLSEAIDNYKNNGEIIPDDENKNSFFKKYFIYIIIGSVLIAGGVITIVIVNKKRSEI